MKSLIRNQLGNTIRSFNLPCDSTVAETFATNNLDGEYAIYESEGIAGNDVETQVNQVTSTLKNTTSDKKITIDFYAKSTLSEDEIRTALVGTTINGVSVDEVYIIGMRAYTIS